jgi:hypothetical protein
MRQANYNIEKKLIEKSIEAFILGLEVYNKPTIKYRIEGFSFFIVNAWELILKAKMLKDGKSIYFKDNPTRTLSIENVINEVYPNKTQPLRINLEKIIVLRNTSTHFITEDYETVYAPLFQANVLLFSEQLQKFHNHDITKYIAQNFLTLSANIEPLTNEQIKLKYPAEISTKLLFQKNDIQITSELNNSDKFSIPIKHNLYQVKSKGTSDFTFKIEKDSEIPVNIVTKYKDPSETHKFSHSNLIIEIQKRLKKQKIDFSYMTVGGEKTTFNGYVLGLVIRFYDIKSDEKFAFKHIVGKSETYTYSQQFAEFVIDEIKKAPQTIVDKLKKANKKR